MSGIILDMNKELAQKWENLSTEERESITREIELLLRYRLLENRHSSGDVVQVADEPAVPYHIPIHEQTYRKRRYKNSITPDFINDILRISEQNLRDRNASEERLQQNRQFFEQWKNELVSHTLDTEKDNRELFEMMKKASAIAEANGLTEDILEQLLAEDND
ncbi:hypothetical protein [Proteiniphilum saccharofermentans]|nr:hypothetical protein [Proteiniphilum saccharofermentans]